MSIRYRLRLFGVPVLSFEIDADEQEYEAEEPVAEVGGGSAHNFERDSTPLDINERYAPWDGFGFG